MITKQSYGAEGNELRGVCDALKLLEFRTNLAGSKIFYPKKDGSDHVKSNT